MKDRIKVLLGVTKDGELAFGEFGLSQTLHQSPRFTASFETVRPFDEDDIDEDYVKDWLDGLDKEVLYDMCVHYDCAPSWLSEEYLNDHAATDIVDCSLYPAEITIGNKTIAFESMSCGQCDCLNDIEIFTDEVAVRKLFGLWKAYHLQVMTSCKMQKDVENTINELVEAFDAVDETRWITNWLKLNFLNLKTSSAEVEENDDDSDAE